MHADVLNVVAQDPGAARGRKHQPHEELEGGRLAGAVSAQKTEDLTVIDREGESIQGAHFAFAEETDLVVLR
jgi:hypothetical protein